MTPQELEDFNGCIADLTVAEFVEILPTYHRHVKMGDILSAGETGDIYI